MKPNPGINNTEEPSMPIIRYRNYGESISKLRKQRKEYFSAKNYDKNIEDVLRKSSANDSELNKKSEKGRTHQTSTERQNSRRIKLKIPDINFTRAFVGYK